MHMRAGNDKATKQGTMSMASHSYKKSVNFNHWLSQNSSTNYF